MKVLDIAVDLETLSSKPNAAIIAIAARPFEFGSSEEIQDSLQVTVNATSCAMYGLNFEMETVKWWSKNEQNAVFKRGLDVSVDVAITKFRDFVKREKEKFKADELRIWCQGTDFDIPILKNIFGLVLCDSVPWSHTNVRDSRTYIFEGMRLLYPNIDDPYSKIPKHEWKRHSCLSDVDNLIFNVKHVYKLIKDKINEQ